MISSLPCLQSFTLFQLPYFHPNCSLRSRLTALLVASQEPFCNIYDYKIDHRTMDTGPVDVTGSSFDPGCPYHPESLFHPLERGYHPIFRFIEHFSE